MIPTIGIMIGAYIGLRCIELLCAAKERFGSRGEQTTVEVAAILALCVAAGVIILLLGSSSISTSLAP